MAESQTTVKREERSMKWRIVAWAFGLAASGSTFALAAQWPAWRGPEDTGHYRQKAVITRWSPDGEGVLWKVPVGGRTTPIVMDNRVFLIAPVGEGLGLRERVIALDADTGKTVWEHSFNVFDTDIVENRVGWTALVGDRQTGNIYAHATGGELYCFSGDGKILWKESLRENFGRVSGFGGRLVNPIVDENNVIVAFLASGWGEHAKPAHRFVAFDKLGGKVSWSVAPGGPPLDTIYSNPVVAIIGGVRQLVAGSADGVVYGMKARTGEVLWSFRLSKLALNATVVVDGNYVYASHSEENLSGTVMGAVVCIDATKRGDLTESGPVWRVDGIEAGYASPAVAGGRLYVVDNSANLYCLDAKFGKTNWRHTLGRVGKGSPVVTQDGVIYVPEVNGTFHILKDDGEKCTTLDVDTLTRPDNAVVEIFGSPAIVDGRVYLVTRYETYCLGAKSGPTASMERLHREPPSADTVPVLMHVVPGEVTVAAGGTRQFEARFFSAAGRPVNAEKVEWSVGGVRATVDDNGLLKSADANAFSAGWVSAKFGSIEGKARVRIAPNVPFQEDFESYKEGETPPGWVGVARKSKIVERDGGKVLQKLAEDASAPFMRLKAYMTPPIPKGFTIVADILGTPKGERFRPDMGLINSRYELTLMGSGQVLRLESWTPVPRLREDVPFEWEVNKWYRVKFQVALANEGAHLRGKVWPRDSAEPSTWSIEMLDPYPNQEGSPGLYAYSPGTTPKSKGPEVFFDNVRVIPND